MAVPESFEPGSGFADDFEATIVKARFGTHERYTTESGDSPVLLILTLDNDEGSEILLPVGKGWIASDDGVSVDHGDVLRFGSNAMKDLIARLLQLYPEWKNYGPGDTRQVGQYIGLRCHWKQEEYEAVSGGKKRSRLMPNKFIKAEKVDGQAAAAGGDDLETDLAALAMSSDSAAAFLKAVVGDKELSARVKAKGLLKAIMDKSASGFFEQHKAG